MTALSASVISVTTEVLGPTFVTLPTSPSPSTTGVPYRMPECDPAAIAICSVKGPAGNEITLAVTGR